MRIDDLYNCECEDCKKDAIINLAANYNSVDDVIKAGLEALKYLHAQGSYSYKDLDQEPYKNLINQTNSFLNKAVTDNNVTDFMRDAFKNDIFIFSHLRTHAQLQEAGSLLLTDDGKIKSFDRFKLDIAKINGLYNDNYLQAEYQFAVSSVQMGEKWQNYVESDRYNLQYRTAQDDKVRISHQPLHGITLPMNNPFWDKFYPPNGWRCRCNAVQVRASKYPATNEENALKAGNIATTQIGKDNKNRLEIFRFNSGKQRLVFPPNHPYNKIKDADKVKKEVKKEIKKNDVEKLKTVEDLSNFTNDLSNKNPELFHRGFKKVNLTLREDINGNTDMNGTINLRQNIIDDLIGGINNINNNIPTTFEQERAFGTYYHEIMHNSNKKGIHYSNLLTPTETRYMELANEFVSRKTLPDFMKKMGGKLNHEILMSDRKNTGYNTMVRNFDSLIRFVDADESKVLSDVKKNLIEGDYKLQQKYLKNAISDHSAYKLKAKTYDSLLKWAKDYSEKDFNAILEHNKKVLKGLEKTKK